MEVVPVSGKVRVGNVPLPSGMVTFHPDTAKGNASNRVPSGLIQSDGSYSLMNGTETGPKEGAPPGWYKVTVTPAAAADTNQAKGQLPDYNKDFTSPRYSSLTVEVKAGAPANAYDFKLSK